MGKAQRIKRHHRKDPETIRPARARLGITFYVLCLLLVVATLAVYWQVTNYPLINTDDREYVTNNAIVRDGLTREGLGWAFNVGYASNWHPLTWLSHMLDSRVYGPDVEKGFGSGGRHLTSLLFHVANTLLLFLLLTRMTGYMWRSAFVAALFALHPLHVESVAWVAERKDVLSTFFMILTLWGYAWYAARPSIPKYLLVFLAFALGLMAKPMLVTVPILLLILDFWPLRRFANGWNWALVREKVPFFALSLASSVVTVRAQSGTGAVISAREITIGERAANAVMSYVVYAGKMFWPQRLANYYTYPENGWPIAEVAFAGLLLAAITYLCLRLARTRPHLLAGWLWYVVTLVPVIGLVQVGSQARADRYTYIPLIGLFIIVANAVPELMLRFKRADAPPSPWPTRISSVMAVGVIAALSAATYVQIGFWRDGITLARHAIAVTQDNWFEEQSLGSQIQDEAERLVNLGRRAEGLRLAADAAAHLRRCLALVPRYADGHNDYGRTLQLTGDLKGAVTEYERAVQLNPKYAAARNNLGTVYLGLGRKDDAIEQFEQVLAVDRRNVFVTFNMGLALLSRGDNDPASQQFIRVFGLRPNDYFAYWARYYAAVSYGRKGNMGEATRLLKEAAQLNETTGIDPRNRATLLLNTTVTP